MGHVSTFHFLLESEDSLTAIARSGWCRRCARIEHRLPLIYEARVRHKHGRDGPIGRMLALDLVLRQPGLREEL